MNEPTILINFDPITWKPTAIFPNGHTDVETAKILELADKMIAAIEESIDEELFS